MAEGGYSEGVPYRVLRYRDPADIWSWSIVDMVDEHIIAVTIDRADADHICQLLTNESN